MKSLLPLCFCYCLTAAQTFALSGGPVFGDGQINTTGIYSGVLQGLNETDATASGPAIPGDTAFTLPAHTTTALLFDRQRSFIYGGVRYEQKGRTTTVATGEPLSHAAVATTAGGTATAPPSSALGLFSLKVPTSGLATGAFMLFVDGEIFSGAINGSADPDNGQVRALLEGAFTLNLPAANATGAVTQTSVTGMAVGQFNAQIRASNSLTAGSLGRLTGMAGLDVGFGKVDSTTLQPVVARVITFTVDGYKQAAAVN